MTTPFWLRGAPQFSNPLCADKDVDPEWFFSADSVSPNPRHIRKARELCFACVEQKDCLKWALKNNEKFGMWGGLTAQERKEFFSKD